MSRSQTFLQLAPEFGGTKFGPFDQVEIRLGSDPSNSEITLPETLGIAPQHVKLLRQQDESYILAPVERTAAVYHYRAGSPRPKQVLTPTAVSKGDAFSLVSPEGPRFVLLLEKDPRIVAKNIEEGQGPMKWPLTNVNMNNRFTRGLFNEIKRRGFAAVFTTRLGNTFMRMSMMIRSGAIFSPVYMVSGILMISGWLFAGGSSCSMYRAARSRQAVQARLSTCQDQLGIQDDGGDASDPTTPDLVKKILEDGEWKNTIDADKDFNTAFQTELRKVFAQPDKYKWVYTRKGSPFTQFKAALEAQGMPDALVRTLAFAAARPNYDRPFTLVQDSEGGEVCGRGPIGLTYRQAVHMGMTVQPDGLAERSLAESQDLQALRALLDATAKEAGVEVEYRDDLVQTVGAELQGGATCIYVDGEDDRNDVPKLAKALRDTIGVSQTKTLPHEGENYWIVSRLVYLYAQDFKDRQLEVTSFDARLAPSMAMSTNSIKKERIEYAMREAATVVARAAAVPCIARFDKEIKNSFPDWFLKNEPQLGSCAILKTFVEYDKL